MSQQLHAVRTVEAARVLPTVVKRLDAEPAELFHRYVQCAWDLRKARLLGDDHRARVVTWQEEGVCFPPLSTDASKEAFESLCVRFRRLRNQNGEPQFEAVRNRLRRCITEGDGSRLVVPPRLHGPMISIPGTASS